MTPEPPATERLTGRESAARIPVLDLLRGLAALAVCLYHFTDLRDGLFRADEPLRRITWHGWLGVEVFFVISGFVIPYSMYLRSYRLRDAGGFVVRRLKRLEPPYLACIALILLLNATWPLPTGWHDQPESVTAPELAAHLGYLSDVLDHKRDSSADVPKPDDGDYEWLNPVFWTLAIEFQFYIFTAIVFPLLVHERLVIRVAALVAVALIGFIDSENPALLPHWLPLFAIGIVSFQWHAGQLPMSCAAVLMVAIAGLSWQIVGDHQTVVQTVVGLATALSILLLAKWKLPRWLTPLTWLGTISYSLYLLHVPIGDRVIAAGLNISEAHDRRYLLLAAALAASVTAALGFWYAVERPSQAWARGGGMKRRSSTTADPPQAQNSPAIEATP